MSAPPRTTPALVSAVLGNDYDTENNPDLTPYIVAASAIVDRVLTMSLGKQGQFSSGFQNGLSNGPDSNTTPTETGLIERWLAAHLYCQSDKPLDSKSTGGASGKYQGSSGLGLETTRYGQMAMRLDWSQSLRNLDKQQRANAFWLGKPPSAQTPVWDRD